MHGILRMIGTTDLVNVYINSELENGPVEIVDLPMKNRDFPVRKLLVYQRVDAF